MPSDIGVEIAMSEPEQQATEKAEDFLSPASFIRAAKAAHPAFRYAIAVAGILAIVVTFIKFGVGPATLVFGAIALIGLMALFLVFAQASKLTRSTLDLPAQVLVWAFLVIAILIVIFLTGSVFFNVPLPFRDWLIQGLVKNASNPVNVTIPVASPAVSPPDSDHKATAQETAIIAELTEGYKATGWQLAFLDDWGRPPTRQTLRVNQTVLTGTAPDGRTVSISLDPHQLPVPQYYNANSAQISALGSKEAPAVIRFFSAYEQYREALVNLTSNPSDLNVALTNATVNAREAMTRGRAALCAMGSTPPRLFPDGGFPEPVPPNCLASPFG
jgi:hypothetical protein